MDTAIEVLTRVVDYRGFTSGRWISVMSRYWEKRSRMMSDFDGVKTRMCTSAEDILSEFAPLEADIVIILIENPTRQRDESVQQVAGTPIAGLTAVLAPLVVGWLATVVESILVDMGIKITTSLGKRIRKWFRTRNKTRMISACEEPDLYLKTVKTITVSLIDAGWTADRAGQIADRIWAEGRSVAHYTAESMS